jgi:hypothetical protein
MWKTKRIEDLVINDNYDSFDNFEKFLIYPLTGYDGYLKKKRVKLLGYK